MRLRLPRSPVTPVLRRMLAAGLKAADPFEAIQRTVRLSGDRLRVGRRTFDLSRYDRIVVVGAGKASARMAQALEPLLKDRIHEGLVVVKRGHVRPTRWIRIVEAGHPVPDRDGLWAAETTLRMAAALTHRDLLIVLLSGGASSLWPVPVATVSLEAKRQLTNQLLRSGAAIDEINAVRKHLSRIKGGSLAASTYATIITLILSDVIGDEMGSIGSGPTVPDPSTFAEAMAILRRYNLWDRTPSTVRRHLVAGRRGLVPETPKRGSRRAYHTIVGSNRSMLEAVARAARAAGCHVVRWPHAIVGEARVAAALFVQFARRQTARSPRLRKHPICVIAGGETTVAVTGRGIGGRAQEFAAAAAVGIAGVPRVWIAAVGSDGTDGPTDVAGALVSGATVSEARRRGIDLQQALAQHDTYPALQRLGCHIVTGPTGTNVNDLYLMLLL